MEKTRGADHIGSMNFNARYSTHQRLSLSLPLSLFPFPSRLLTFSFLSPPSAPRVCTLARAGNSFFYVSQFSRALSLVLWAKSRLHTSALYQGSFFTIGLPAFVTLSTIVHELYSLAASVSFIY